MMKKQLTLYLDYSMIEFDYLNWARVEEYIDCFSAEE